MIIIKALYGLKSAGAAFRSYLAKQLHDMEYTLSKADADVWMRLAFKPDGEEYYKFMLVYVDNLLSILHDPQTPMEELKDTIKFKNNKVMPPEMYLGAKLQKKDINGLSCWSMTSCNFIYAAVANVEEKLSKEKC